MQLYFVRGNPKDGEAEELLRANGRDLSKPHKIILLCWARMERPLSNR